MSIPAGDDIAGYDPEQDADIYEYWKAEDRYWDIGVTFDRRRTGLLNEFWVSAKTEASRRPSRGLPPRAEKLRGFCCSSLLAALVLHRRLGCEGRSRRARHLARVGQPARWRCSGYSMQHLTVCDEGDRLAISFGPLPLFRKRIRYDDIIGVEIRAHDALLDRWGIQRVPLGVRWAYHWSPWGGWLWRPSAGKRAARSRRRRGVHQECGTGTALRGWRNFLKSRTGGQSRPATIHQG